MNLTVDLYSRFPLNIEDATEGEEVTYVKYDMQVLYKIRARRIETTNITFKGCFILNGEHEGVAQKCHPMINPNVKIDVPHKIQRRLCKEAFKEYFNLMRNEVVEFIICSWSFDKISEVQFDATLTKFEKGDKRNYY